MRRILGLDYGTKTVGVALSDELRITAQPLETITRKDANKLRKTYARIEELVKEYDIEKIVLGLPKNMNNTVGERGEDTLSFRDALVRRTGLEVILWDERLTTVASEKVLMESGVRRENRKKVIDQIAASMILQGYLDSLQEEQTMSKTDNKILFLDEDGSEIEFRVIEQTTIAGHTYLLVEDCEASSEDESVVLIMKEVQLEDDYVSYEIVEDDKELDMISDIFNALLDGLEVSL